MRVKFQHEDLGLLGLELTLQIVLIFIKRYGEKKKERKVFGKFEG